MTKEYLIKFNDFLDSMASKKSGIADTDYETIHKIFTKYLKENNNEV
jgi:hypothetical protein